LLDVFAETGADIMIHGHTHRPALHRRRQTPLRAAGLGTGCHAAARRLDRHHDDGAITRHDLTGAVIAS
jgi:UDP-2,3-diacylglucosamine hydrolase